MAGEVSFIGGGRAGIVAMIGRRAQEQVSSRHSGTFSFSTSISPICPQWLGMKSDMPEAQ